MRSLDTPQVKTQAGYILGRGRTSSCYINISISDHTNGLLAEWIRFGSSEWREFMNPGLILPCH